MRLIRVIWGGQSYTGHYLGGFWGLAVGPLTVWLMAGWWRMPWLTWVWGRCVYLRVGPLGLLWWRAGV